MLDSRIWPLLKLCVFLPFAIHISIKSLLKTRNGRKIFHLDVERERERERNDTRVKVGFNGYSIVQY